MRTLTVVDPTEKWQEDKVELSAPTFTAVDSIRRQPSCEMYNIQDVNSLLG